MLLLLSSGDKKLYLLDYEGVYMRLENIHENNFYKSVEVASKR